MAGSQADVTHRSCERQAASGARQALRREGRACVGCSPDGKSHLYHTGPLCPAWASPEANAHQSPFFHHVLAQTPAGSGPLITQGGLEL